MQAWKIVLLNPTRDWDRYVKEKAVFVGRFGPDEIKEVDKFSCKEDLEEYLSEGAAAELWKFSNELKDGDLVLVTTDKDVLGVGKLKGEYEYEPIYDAEDECYNKSHVRRAEWSEIKPKVPRLAGDPLFKPLPKEFEALNDQIKIVKLSPKEWEAIGKKYPKIREASQKLGYK